MPAPRCSMKEGSLTAMAAGHVLEFPGWDALEATPPEVLKRWRVQQRYVQDARHVAMVGTKGTEIHTHRVQGAVARGLDTPMGSHTCICLCVYVRLVFCSFMSGCSTDCL